MVQIVFKFSEFYDEFLMMEKACTYERKLSNLIEQDQAVCNHFQTFPCDTPTIFEIDLSNIQINYMHKELLNVEVTI